MKLTVIIFTCIILATLPRVLSAQYYTEADWITRMDQGVDQMYQGNYEKADSLFQLVLRKLETLPSDLAFYFGRNSFYLEKYKQSINWLNKYIELKGTKGQYFEETIQILEAANAKFTPIRASEVDDILAELTRVNLIECPTGRMICPVCKGSGVVIRKGKFDAIYRTCPFSGGEGYLSCEDYNLFLRGELEVQGGN